MLEVSETSGAGEVAAALLKKLCSKDARLYLHSWTAEPEIAIALLRHFPNAILGFTGSATFAKSLSTHELIFDCPLDRLVLGSCSPFSHPNVTPPPKPGQQCHPGLLPHIAVKIAELKGIDIEDVLEAAWANSVKFFAYTPPPAQTEQAATTEADVAKDAFIDEIDKSDLPADAKQRLIDGAAAAAEMILGDDDADQFQLTATAVPEAGAAAAATPGVLAAAEVVPIYLRGAGASKGGGGGRGRGRGRGRSRGGAAAPATPALVVSKTMSAAERAKAVAQWQAEGEPGGLQDAE